MLISLFFLSLYYCILLSSSLVSPYIYLFFSFLLFSQLSFLLRLSITIFFYHLLFLLLFSHLSHFFIHSHFPSTVPSHFIFPNFYSPKSPILSFTLTFLLFPRLSHPFLYLPLYLSYQPHHTSHLNNSTTTTTTTITTHHSYYLSISIQYLFTPVSFLLHVASVSTLITS